MDLHCFYFKLTKVQKCENAHETISFDFTDKDLSLSSKYESRVTCNTA